MLANRFLRFALVFIVVVVLAIAGVIAALFFRVNEDSVKKTVEELSAKALGATVVFDGPVKVSRLSTMQVQLPAMTFVEKENPDVVIGRVDGIDAEVSMWSLALGAVQVQSATVNGLDSSLEVAQLSGDALFDSTFARINFPDDLRINAVTFKNAKIDLTVAAHQTRYAYRLSDLYFSMGKFSPEVTTPFEISAHFDPLKATTASTSDAPSESQSENRLDNDQQPQSDSEASTQALAEPTASDEAKPEPQPEAPLQSEPIQDQVSPEPQSETSSLTQEETQPDQKPEDTAPSLDNDEPQVEPKPAAEPNPMPSDQTVSLYRVFGVDSAYASTPDFIESEAIFLSFDPETNSGAFSAKGTLTISSQDRYVVLENVSFSGETTIDSEPLTVVATADRIRFKDAEVSGSNATAALSRPQQLSGDVHLGAVDFRLRPGIFESPELRLSYAKQSQSRTTTLEITSSVKADLLKHKTDLENFSSRVTVTGDPTLPVDFAASLSGFVHIDHDADLAQVGLSGSFANAPFSYNGTVTQLSAPKFVGELMIGEINTATVPAFQSLDWMHKVNFEGSLRVGQILWRSLSATQLHCGLTLSDGKATLSDIIVNTADGRLMGHGDFSEDTSWEFAGKLDGVDLKKVLTGFETIPIVSGITSGQLALAGKGYDASTLKAKAQIRVLRAAYHGIDAQAARNYIAGSGTQDSVTRQGAFTALDEATANIDVDGQTMTISDISARGLSLRAVAQAKVNLQTGEIKADVQNTFAPMHGIPSVHIAAEISGAASAPQWHFGWTQANTALRRAQGKSAVEVAKPAETAKPRKEEKSLWQSVKDFFSF